MKNVMRKHIKIVIALLTFFGFGFGSWAQIDVPRNEDGAVEKDTVLAWFEAYLNSDSVPQLPDTTNQDDLGNFVMDFFFRIHLPFEEDYGPEMRTMVINRVKQLAREEERQDDMQHLSLTIGIGAVGLTVIILIIVLVSKRKKSVVPLANQAARRGTESDDSNIVIRHTTSAVERKQNIDDVIGNNNYLEIDCISFVNDSAVHSVFLKASCIKAIYNLYADDLRNPENPKEDGCMVLGRWIQDKKSKDYYVTLEHVVFPGNDAVFTEYELNFGGKIKMDVREKLRKLRVETDMQYDLTCWVHSHPGLGVFFSNNDCSVQNLLKHPSHPNFLTALVVDILTPKQEMGLFTFKHDGTINSRNEMRQLFSLEEWYQWAVEQERNSFNAEDYQNGLESAKQRSDNCHGIELSNGAIIDMGRLAVEYSGELVSTVYGYSIERKGAKEYVAIKVVNEKVPDCDPIGAFVMVSHCSIPSVKKAVVQQLGNIKFVLVYSTSDGLLTSIPVVDGNLCTDENYYGEQQLEDLKIWTRRKR